MMTATIVVEHLRTRFLPGLFGTNNFMMGEGVVFSFASKLSPEDYDGGMWEFYEIGIWPGFMAPKTSKRFHVVVEGNGYEGQVSSEAFGIICTMFSLSHLSFRHQSDHLATAYERLYDYASTHAEASAIFQAID